MITNIACLMGDFKMCVKADNDSWTRLFKGAYYRAKACKSSGPSIYTQV